MENNNQNQPKKGFNKLLVIIPIVIALGVGVFLAIKFLVPQKVEEFELHTKGRYANFIKDAKTKYETRNGRNIRYVYENVIYDDVSNKREVIESRDDVAMASYIVTLIPENTNEIVNYQCDILKSEFTREVESMLKNQDTSFIKDAVVAADAINSVRLKGEDIPLDLEIGDIELGGGLAGGAVEAKGKLGKIAVNTDIGKISNLVGDTVIGIAAGGEDVLNKLLKDNKKAKADEFVANLDDVTYYSLMLSFAKKMYVEVSDPLREEDVLRRLDRDGGDGRKQYQMLKEKYLNGTVKASDNDNTQENIKKNLYEEKLKELGIKKVIRKGFNTSSITNACIGYSKFSIPTYYIADERNEFLDDRKWYRVDDNDSVKLYLIRDDDEVAGNNVSEYNRALSEGKISENIESIIQENFKDYKAEVFDYEDVEINSQKWNKFKVLSDEYYYEVVEFLDVNTELTSDKVNDKYVFIILREPISDGLEYNEDFSKIIGSIKKIETVKLGRDLDEIKKSGFIDAKEYLENKGFYNFEIYYMKEPDGLFGLDANKNNEIETITINNNSKLKSDDNVRQDAKIVIEYYNTAKYNEEKEKNEKIDKYLEERNRRNEELEEEQRLQREKEENENRLNSKQSLSLEEIDKVKLVTEYNDDTVIDEIDTVKFGKYPQDSRDEDDKQDIEWIVLDRKDGKALLLSKYILDCKKYDELDELERLTEKASKNIEEYEKIIKVVTEKFPEINDMSSEEGLVFMEQQDDEDSKKFLAVYKEYKYIQDDLDKISITWNDSFMRKWLNESFTNIAFSNSEKESIVESNIKNFDNFEYKTKGGESTEDKVFCLSIDEIEKYFGDINDSNSKLITKGTKYARTIDNDGKNLLVKEENSPYWLRTPGLNGHRVMSIFEDGTISNQGEYANFVRNGVRPAMWVKY
ncbi:MAG: hypothetical protein J6M39_08265 [Lachnospiraceae bacterium]|nr:hypothetical protein [Lachnospiraceae bacterium]